MTEHNPEFETNSINIKVAHAIGLNPHEGNHDNFWGVGVGYFLPEETGKWYAKYKPEQFGFNLMLGSRGENHECTYPIPDFHHKIVAAMAALDTIISNKGWVATIIHNGEKCAVLVWKKDSLQVGFFNSGEFFWSDLPHAICRAILWIDDYGT